MDLKTPLAALPGVGPSMNYRLSRLKLYTVEDLLYHFPFRYDDFTNTTNVLEARVGEVVTLRGEIWSIKNVYTRARKIITQAIFNDGTGPVNLTWFNQQWLTKQLQVGDKLQISGQLNKYKSNLSIVAPIWEKLNPTPGGSAQTIHTGRLVPVYPETFGLTSKWLVNRLAELLPKVSVLIEDPLPEDIKDGMLGLTDAIKKIHLPDNLNDVKRAQDRLGFDELFYIQLATQKTRMEWQKKPLISEELRIKNYQLKVRQFIDTLPFELTGAQIRVVGELLEDLQKLQPMNRLVQGEVGSGKTVVAAVIAYIVHLNGLKTIYMAPTEILAFQHHKTLASLFGTHGPKVGIYTGSKKQIEKSDIIVGTHALLNLNLEENLVGLVIVDEQQRFGVEQRSLLRGKAKLPHFLTMTATPIPRTVALTLYGDLNLSIIDELPKNRLPVKTYVVPKHKRDDAYGFIRKHVEAGEQAYIITPLIEESETLQSVKSAKAEFDRLTKQVFPDLKLGLLHGRLKSKEKDRVLTAFKNHEIDILVSTTVVEVGVDVPNATIMVIEGAERFGLAQLHQLRGRVGRGDKQSYCLLFSEDPQASSQLKSLETIFDGLKLAQLDLKIRGSGELFGTRQSGRWNLKIADLTDLQLVEKTKAAANKILQASPTLDKYPLVKGKLASLSTEVAPD